jgi:uncharacterized protein YjbI with pentapeptide repeats
MLITADLLRSKNACSDGLEDFLRDHPNGYDYDDSSVEAQIRQLKEVPIVRRFWGWAVFHGLIRSWSMKDAVFTGADLRRVCLWTAILRRADLSGADLVDADLVDADLGGSNLKKANLKGASLVGANLRGTHLTGANLRGTHLTGANLRGTHLMESP